MAALSGQKQNLSGKIGSKKALFLLRSILIAMGLCLLVGYLFYNNLLVGLAGAPIGIIYVRKAMKQYEKRRRAKLAVEFCDGMQAVVSALVAGYSVENAFKESLAELELMYGKKSAIYEGFYKLCNELRVNVNVEEAFSDFAKDCDVEEITSFAEILRYAKRSGGNMVEIIKNTTYSISEKMDVSREIATIISAKKLEQNIMNLVPLGIILYMRITNGELFGNLYGNMLGIMVMTGCLAVYGFAKILADRIVDIKV